jgi:hypothetical protein
MEEQEKLLNKYQQPITIIHVPTSGWDLAVMQKIAGYLQEYLWSRDRKLEIVFASPIPYLVSTLSFIDGRVDSIEGQRVFVFHNDKRDKKELPNGKIIYTVAKEGWQIV